MKLRLTNLNDPNNQTQNENLEMKYLMYNRTKSALRASDVSKMNQRDVEMIELLLSAEKNAYFKKKREKLHPETLLQRFKKDFVKDFSCCTEKFENFDYYAIHLRDMHNIFPEFDSLRPNKFLGDYQEEAFFDALFFFDGFNPNLPISKPQVIKPYACSVIGCEKSYKNQNGLKYHVEHHHKDLFADIVN
ncbi:hypothetical protein CWI39_0087p0010 [Hamiltosporidium magnivora]|uniref:C2H2-type domain-containing protein n=1 Tax=Hamiltosporidium magnivora TaxID=148818 RepID=A0A4Q9LP23_9MICR|nr:hypothetical protein CWI39_0087p0010 [Hamiltosporidium magnivora]